MPQGSQRIGMQDMCRPKCVTVCRRPLTPALGPHCSRPSRDPLPLSAVETASRASVHVRHVCSAFIGVARMASAHLVTRDPRGPRGTPGTLDALAVSLFQNTGCCCLSPRGGLKRNLPERKPLGTHIYKMQKLFFVPPETSRQ